MMAKMELKKYFILIAADVDKNLISHPSAYAVALYRLMRSQWGLNARTRNRNVIKPGDHVVVYASGRRLNGMCFVGKAIVKNAAQPTTLVQKKILSDPSGLNKIASEYYLSLEKTVVFNRPVEIRPLLKSLEFIKNPESSRWGLPLVGGTLRISERDFATILKSAGANKNSEVLA